jgi:hypothetical protein
MPAADCPGGGSTAAQSSPLPADGPVARESACRNGAIRPGTPVVDRDNARLKQLQAIEEPCHLRVAAKGHSDARKALVQATGHLSPSLWLDVAGRDGDREVASRRHGVGQPGRERVGILNHMQDGQQHDRDRLAEVQNPGRLPEDRVRVIGVGVQVGGLAPGCGGQQGAGMGQHERERGVGRVRVGPVGAAVAWRPARDPADLGSTPALSTLALVTWTGAPQVPLTMLAMNGDSESPRLVKNPPTTQFPCDGQDTDDATASPLTLRSAVPGTSSALPHVVPLALGVLAPAADDNRVTSSYS